MKEKGFLQDVSGKNSIKRITVFICLGAMILLSAWGIYRNATVTPGIIMPFAVLASAAAGMTVFEKKP